MLLFFSLMPPKQKITVGCTTKNGGLVTLKIIIIKVKKEQLIFVYSLGRRELTATDDEAVPVPSTPTATSPTQTSVASFRFQHCIDSGFPFFSFLFFSFSSVVKLKMASTPLSMSVLKKVL